jgi:hypothetical protein
VPPVVNTRLQPTLSTSSTSVRSITGCSSGINRVSLRQGEESAAVSHSINPGMPLSSYTPVDARSEIETRPMMSESAVVMARL